MDLGNRLRWWWDRVRGYEPQAAKPVPPARERAQPAATRPVHPVVGTESHGSLELSVEGKPTRGGRKRRAGEAGFDPYANSGGYGKPRGWDDVSRK